MKFYKKQFKFIIKVPIFYICKQKYMTKCKNYTIFQIFVRKVPNLKVGVEEEYNVFNRQSLFKKHCCVGCGVWGVVCSVI